jgi:hypothetical protein
MRAIMLLLAVALATVLAVVALRSGGPERQRPQAAATPVDGAPVLSVEGRTLSWEPVAGADDYVLATKIAGEPDVYRVVDGLSTTPPPVPGTRVTYGLRANLEGSPWAREVAISYPAAAVGIETGLVAEANAVGASRWADAGLRPRLVRLEFGISSPAAELRPAIEAHAANGSRALLLAGFHGEMPTPDEARNLADWARAYGPRGAFWAGRHDGHLAVRTIEFGNETSFGHQYGDTPGDESHVARAREYAQRFVEARAAIREADPGVDLLAQADPASSESAAWIDGMFDAVPDLGEHVGGWTVHQYGPRQRWEPRIDRLVDQTVARGASDDIPIWITEWGLSSDDGRCLSDNYGWDPCMSYADAATALRESVAQMRAEYGDRLRAFLLYQGRDQLPPGASPEREHYFGALRSDGTPKGEYTDAVRALLASPP